ncbi:MAG: class I SAM-dependent methyltransferase [Pseudomonadales bacterium]|nr:class I SAM-dependent methyltransferase [Pseudomonadales bacterium]MCP5188060.1 class I SAM-dependent methyltransferase [Pseudomonadales bacterium]
MFGKTFSHYLGVLLGSELPQTQTTLAERDLLKKYIPGKKRIVEIGVFEGFTTQVLAEESDPDSTIYGVDPFFRGRLAISWGLQITKQYNRKYLASGKLRLVQTLSTEVGTQIPIPVDFVFIDGDHSLGGITADWEFWTSRIVSGGIIALHDTVLKPDQPKSAELGSHHYFQSHIQQDFRFDFIDQVDSLSILKKR